MGQLEISNNCDHTFTRRHADTPTRRYAHTPIPRHVIPAKENAPAVIGSVYSWLPLNGLRAYSPTFRKRLQLMPMIGGPQGSDRRQTRRGRTKADRLCRLQQ